MNNRVRIYEPYGFGESYQYESIPTRIDNELSESQANDSKQFASVAYNEDAKALIFKNVGNVEQGRVYLKDIIGLQTLIQKAYYDEGTKDLVIVFNEEKSDVVRIPLDKIIDVTEAGNGLVQNDGKFHVLIDQHSEKFLSVSQNGVKVSGVNDAIDRAVTKEQSRAVAQENELDQKIGAETSRATQSETDLNDGLKAEIRNRESSDEDLSNRIKTEITNRTSSDITLQSNIDIEANNRIDGDNAIKAIIGDGFTSTPTETITKKYVDLGARISNEISDRTTQDNVLQTNINNEVTARSGEITRVVNLITAESKLRVDDINTVNNSLVNETNTRIDEDKKLADNIAKETNTRINKDTELAGNITKEIEDRRNADAALQTNINNEVTARSGEITRVEDLITAVNNSLAHETTTRIDKDTELADKIANETNTRIDKDTELAGNIAKEIKDRENQDAALQANIDSEAHERAEADTNLQAAITTHTTNTVVHVTQEEKDKWNSKAETASIPTKVSQLTNDKGYLTSNDLTSSYLTDILNRLSTLESKVAALESNSL